MRPSNFAYTGLAIAHPNDTNFTSPLPPANISPPQPLMPSFAPDPPDDVRIIENTDLAAKSLDSRSI